MDSYINAVVERIIILLSNSYILMSHNTEEKSHHTEENKVCPNCGSITTGNYCYQCGQETHLHSDSFWGLVMHFVGHYFHYDSKFWMTVKAMLFHPGRLTTAYWNKQRMRYIPPISLYIFISAIFFLTNSLVGNPDTVDINKQTDTHQVTEATTHTTTHELTTVTPPQSSNSKLRTILNRMRTNAAVLDSDGSHSEQMNEHFFHMLPRVFFFMIPFMAFLLSVWFIRRKDTFFANNVIFSLHFQSLLFTLMLVLTLLPASSIDNYLTLFMLLSTTVYFAISVKNVYATGWFSAILCTLFTTFFYLLTLLIAIMFVVVML